MKRVASLVLLPNSKGNHGREVSCEVVPPSLLQVPALSLCKLGEACVLQTPAGLSCSTQLTLRVIFWTKPLVLAGCISRQQVVLAATGEQLLLQT